MVQWPPSLVPCGTWSTEHGTIAASQLNPQAPCRAEAPGGPPCQSHDWLTSPFKRRPPAWTHENPAALFLCPNHFCFLLSSTFLSPSLPLQSFLPPPQQLQPARALSCSETGSLVDVPNALNQHRPACFPATAILLPLTHPLPLPPAALRASWCREHLQILES